MAINFAIIHILFEYGSEFKQLDYKSNNIQIYQHLFRNRRKLFLPFISPIPISVW